MGGSESTEIKPNSSKRKSTKQKTSATAVLEEKINEMEIEGFENLPKLFILPTEKMMDEYTGSVKELRGLFKIPKNQYSNWKLALTNMQHRKETIRKVSNWIHRTDVSYKNCNSQKLLKGY